MSLITIILAIFAIAFTIFVGVIYASFCEYWLHRKVMHKPVGPFTYPYRTHALTHHRMFDYDATYHLINPDQDKWTIPMAWWNGPVLTLLATIPTIPFGIFISWWICFIIACTVFAYYLIYEYSHWCMHLPRPERQRLIERSWIFYRLNGHHLLHHRYMGMNFNVVLPIWDYILGTLILRSKMKFPQPRGPSVPDVQPLEPAVPHSVIASK